MPMLSNASHVQTTLYEMLLRSNAKVLYLCSSPKIVFSFYADVRADSYFILKIYKTKSERNRGEKIAKTNVSKSDKKYDQKQVERSGRTFCKQIFCLCECLELVLYLFCWGGRSTALVKTKGELFCQKKGEAYTSRYVVF